MIKSICYYASLDSRFETELGYNFNKGLLIQGTAGLGKTKTIEAIKNNLLFSISVISLIDIADIIRKDGYLNLNTNNHILLDDVGSEQEIVNYYGTKINWFKDFIETYYLKHKNFNKLIMTTNCGGDEIENKYGYRVRSRIREMFNTIQIYGQDKRK
jgi:DNA replication protein DnaC